MTVGVDYKSFQPHNQAPHGDGMTDHFITVMGITETLSNGNVTSRSFRFFDPRTGNGGGTQPSNVLNYNNGTLSGSFQKGRNKDALKYTVTTVRAVK